MQTILYETSEKKETVALALRNVNKGGYLDTQGEKVEPIRWDCGCLQKKCGACAMRINGVPRLACDAVLENIAQKGVVKLEPLRKFPPVADLMVDRQPMWDHLAALGVWAEAELEASEQVSLEVYEASRCMQCGCCLEICPNFSLESSFFGAAGFVPAARLLHLLPPEELERMEAAYQIHVHEGCGKSLACAKICPAGIDAEHLLLRSNKITGQKKKKKTDS